MRPAVFHGLLLGLFALSGFSGLIYESIWTRYLQLFLGHAAYAQTLVLSIYMGGLAVGSWLGARYSPRLGNLLFAYALVEAAIGLFGLVFHPTYVIGTGFAYGRLIPSLDSMMAVHALNWTLAALLILPQTILLGMTFPLLSGGLIRLSARGSGWTLAMLYFSNSLGAVLGVLLSAFLLVDWLGLPGALDVAGLANLLVAMGVLLLLLRKRPEKTHDRVGSMPVAVTWQSRWSGLLAVAMLTGLASFLYEIGWIRMLNLVLGSTTHSFELMLSAFILGLALGGLWIRRRIDHLRDPMVTLGLIQITMAVLALSSVPLYNATFDFMAVLMDTVQRTDRGYLVFLGGSHVLAGLIMLPATFCAGMTLPLVTHILLRQGAGERAIGLVYGVNTLGAILGILVSVHLLMEWVGLKGILVGGAMIDLALGVALLVSSKGLALGRLPALAGTGYLILVAGWVHWDPQRISSGVFRHGSPTIRAGAEVLYLKDGKTATVSLIRGPTGLYTIATNGKPDASINMLPDGPLSPDQATQVLLGALPLSVNPQARQVAVVGMGSGMSSHVLLGSPAVTSLDTIEIEPRMVEAARLFLPRVERTFFDPRSHIRQDDARSFFAAQRRRYDIILAEPSNPWVSGVSSLFTRQFYALVRRSLRQDGVFAQWLQLYEIDGDLVGTVMGALASVFPEYEVYQAGDSNLVILAGERGSVRDGAERVFGMPEVTRELKNVGITRPSGLRALRLGSRRVLGPLLEQTVYGGNSDYFPVLDMNAPRVRFLDRDFIEILFLQRAPIPVLEMLGDPLGGWMYLDDGTDVSLKENKGRVKARRLRGFLTGQADAEALRDLKWETRLAAVFLKTPPGDCSAPGVAGEWFESLYDLWLRLSPYLDGPDLVSLLNRWQASPCAKLLKAPGARWLEVLNSVARRDGPRMSEGGRRLLEVDGPTPAQRRYLVSVAMLGDLSRGRVAEAADLWRDAGVPLFEERGLPMELRLLRARCGRPCLEAEKHLAAKTAGNPGNP